MSVRPAAKAPIVVSTPHTVKVKKVNCKADAALKALKKEDSFNQQPARADMRSRTYSLDCADIVFASGMLIAFGGMALHYLFRASCSRCA